jgi:Arm DNA-binding domain
MTKISKRTVDVLEPQNWDVDHHNEYLKCCDVRVRSSGRKTYFALKRNKCVVRRFTIGSHGAVTAEAARLNAKQINSDLAIARSTTCYATFPTRPTGFLA